MDPRVKIAGQSTMSPLSPLMQAKLKGDKGEKTSFCPYGCGAAELDDSGYCRHLVGFTNDKKVMEPMRVNSRGLRQVAGSEPEAVRAGDQFVQITVSWRVYRDVDERPEKKADKAK